MSELNPSVLIIGFLHLFRLTFVEVLGFHEHTISCYCVLLFVIIPGVLVSIEPMKL